ncbi:MAG: chemotaxis protein [Myxococcales bacterium]|nr:chemotaxis protein [Myxococcales bacterium]
MSRSELAGELNNSNKWCLMALSQTTKGSDVGIERISKIADELTVELGAALKRIEKISSQTQVLSINAKIRAARAGNAGRAFGVVADEVALLSKQISEVTSEMEERSSSTIAELSSITRHIATDHLGTRLMELALVNIDLIDRNLYERTCDVRWWATDGSLVAALAQQTPESRNFASKRLGVILDSYTVYFDLVLCDLKGNVIANGRPGKFSTQDSNHSDAEWFKAAIKTHSGTEYGFQSVHRSPLVNSQLGLVYSCTVREGGDANGSILGVLGIVFDWASLAQEICENLPLSLEEKAISRVCIVDDAGLVLADSNNEILTHTIEIKGRSQLFSKTKGYVMEKVAGSDCMVAHAQSPGYETYKTGWHALIIQQSR